MAGVKSSKDLAHEIVQSHMDRAGVIGCWELLEDRIAAALRSREGEMRAYLGAIALLGGNLPDDRLTDRTGPNDAAHRGLMYCEARSIARKALG